MQNILISIKPQYVTKIIAGAKKVEFRKKFPSVDIEKVYIYSSSPQKRILGYFTIKSIDKDCPSQVWKKYSSIGGIDESSFLKYFENKEDAIAILFDEVFVFKTSIDPHEIFSRFYPPQNYMFIEEIFIAK